MPNIYPEITFQELQKRARFHGLTVRQEDGRFLIAAENHPTWILCVADTQHEAAGAMPICRQLATDCTDVLKRVRIPNMNPFQHTKRSSKWMFSHKNGGFRQKVKLNKKKPTKAMLEKARKDQATKALINEVNRKDRHESEID
jgi:hypothetical protein